MNRVLLSSLLLLSCVFAFSASPLAANDCDVLNSEIDQHAQEQAKYRDSVSDKSAVFARSLFDLHRQLRSLENKTVDDLNWATGTLRGLADSLQNFSEEAFEKAAKDYEAAEDFKSKSVQCYGDSIAVEIENWSIKNQEILNTVGGVYSLYISRFSEWADQWQALAQNKARLDRGQFDEVEATANEFAEAKRLTLDLLLNTQTDFENIWKK